MARTLRDRAWNGYGSDDLKRNTFATTAAAHVGLAQLASGQASRVCGDIRISFITPTLIRIEKRGPHGFEDRPTFNVASRSFGKLKMIEEDRPAGMIEVRCGNVGVKLPREANSLSQVEVLSNSREIIYKASDKPVPSQFLPAPGKMPKAWALSDAPRLVPAKWGATPTPAGNTDPASGWDRTNDAPDLYVFVAPDYQTLRRDFLKLTGPTEKPPLYAFGFIDSRYHPYTDTEALGVMDKYRQKHIPLDMFVVDTDWRINGSHGYAVELKDFPDMRGFLAKTHAKNLKVMFNDHPDPVSEDALDPKELNFRYDGISKILDLGVDVWWYDRNWSTSLVEPMPGIRKEEWGQRIYHDMTLKFKPDQRPLIMTNFQGIDNGIRRYAPQPAGHRYPMWWTGDTASTWDFLKRGIQNGVDMGVLALSSYVGEDLGGHQGQPSPELYTRFLEYGCLSPTTRIHCTRGRIRYPWEFGAEAEKIVTDYIRLRYRLLPMIYSAAQRNYDDGTPLLRRCDIEWPNQPGADRNDQYLFGDDLLVAPINPDIDESLKAMPTNGMKAEFFNGTELQGAPILSRIDKTVDFDWGEGAPAQGLPTDNFSARWTGEIGPIARTGDYTLAVRSDDGARLWVDGKQVVNAWEPQDSVEHRVKFHFTEGSRHTIRLEYYEGTGNANVRLGWRTPADAPLDSNVRTAWIPPGQWTNLYTGETVVGPKTVTVRANLSECPMWARAGGMIPLAPVMEYSGEKPWDDLTLDTFLLDHDGKVKRELAEDDGISNRYQKGEVIRTALSQVRSGKQVTLSIKPAEARWVKSPLSRAWTVRLNLPAGESVRWVEVDGKPVPFAHHKASGSLVHPPLLDSNQSRNDFVTIAIPKALASAARRVEVTLRGH